MFRSLLSIFAAGCACVAVAGAQSTTTQTTSLADQTPQENARGGSVAERAPGRIIDAARARHNALMAERLSSRRNGESTSSNQSVGSNGTAGAPRTSGSSVSGLINSLNSSGLLGSISGLLNGTGGLNGLSGLLGGGSTSAGASSGSGGLADLIRQRVAEAQAGNAKTINNATAQVQQNTVASQTNTVASSGGAVGRLQKSTQSREQSQVEETPFRIRLADAVIGRIFDGISGGLLLPAFVDFLADGIRPLFGLADPNATDNTTDDTNNNNGGNSNDGSNNNGGSTI